MPEKSEYVTDRETTKAEAHWLNRERLTLYSGIFLTGYLVSCIGAAMLKNMYDQRGIPFGSDFIVFWAASHLALAGHAQDAYNSSLLLKTEQLVTPAFTARYIWFYPPSFYLVVLPLALLPYLAAYWTFMLSTLGGYLLVLRRLIRGKTAMSCLAGFSGLWVNIFDGQNGLLTAAIAGAALLSVERRPVVAGVFIGLLAIKPHLAILFPVALIAIGAWRTLIMAAVTAITFTAMSTAILGIAVLKGFFANLGHVRLYVENSSFLWTRMPSVFAFVRLLGTPVTWAYVVHCIVAAVAVIAVWQVWRHCQNWNLRGAALMTATFLVSPYAYDYDLAWLAFPIAWLALDGVRNGWLRGEREVLVAAWLMPLLMSPIAGALKFQIGPLVLCSLLWITVRRANAASMMDDMAADAYADQFEPVP